MSSDADSPMSPSLDVPQYAGLIRAIQRPAEDDWNPDAVADDEVDDDMAGEKGLGIFSCVSHSTQIDFQSDNNGDEGDDLASEIKISDLSQMRAVIAEHSKGVNESTDAEYKRYVCLFLHDHRTNM